MNGFPEAQYSRRGSTSPRCFRMSIALPYAPTPGKISLSAAMISSAVVTSFTVNPSLMMAFRTERTFPAP